MHTLLIISFLSTAYMTGLIWFVQLVHYPMFSSVPPSCFPAFEIEHSKRTSAVVILPMIVELVASVLIVIGAETDSTRLYGWIGLGLVAVIWMSTFFLQVPCHSALSRGYDSRIAKRLVHTNWIRTAAWTLRSAMLAACLLAWS
jgi:uncharacterized membrane protein